MEVVPKSLKRKDPFMYEKKQHNYTSPDLSKLQEVGY